MSSPHKSPPAPPPYDPPKEPIEVLYEDQHIIAFSKPDAILSVPGKGEHLADCMSARIQAKYPEALIVHRLDMDTSGVFMMARDKETQKALGQMFERREIKKTYIADIWGHPNEECGLVDLPLRCDWDNRPVQMVCYEHGRPAQTRWEVVERKTSLRGAPAARQSSDTSEHSGLLHSARNDEEIKFTRVKLEPITGRSHQLRVHMRELGHPILGDVFYADGEALAAAPRLMLHAQSLEFEHPIKKTALMITAENMA